MDRSRVGIVIPAFNEESSIGEVIKICLDFGIPIVVDDGSSDNTAEVARSEGAEVVSHEVNAGYDAALNSGFIKADELKCEFVVTIDADGQHNPEILGKIISLLEKHADIVICIRDSQQRFAEYCFALLTKALYGISDPLCGLKGYRISIYKALGHFDSYNSIGTELALFSVRSGYKLQQIPIVVQERNDLPRFGRKLYANYKIFRAMLLSCVKVRTDK
ncbi:glycosyltransferase family 2 protein [Candidatus Woesearchaeota archaeon]|nr:glycosyltransferase family 2 protein [Candidatus Woesearchaeota archaeon]